jgi:hypothetical protein
VNGQQTGVMVTLAVVGVVYAAALVVMFKYATARTPAGIVRRLARTHRPVTLIVSVRNPGAWDPSRPLGHGGFYAPGTATYELVDSTTVRVRYQPRSGAAIERSGEIPDSLLPDTADMRRRRMIARVVISVYVLLAVGTFALTLTLMGGSTSVRTRAGAVAALAAVSIAWLATHLLLTRQRHNEPQDASGTPGERVAVPSRHLVGWAVGAALVAAALAVAWHLGNTDQPDQMSWPSAFLSAGVFVLAGLAVVTASTHHHTYIHHTEPRRHGKKQ